MSVSTTHRDYDKFAPKWKRCRDCVSGQDAIHAAAEAYLPRLKDEDATGDVGYRGYMIGGDSNYQARLKRSDFFNGTWRTIAGLGGMAFRKSPTVQVPAGIAGYLDDINMAGVSMDGLAMDALDEVLSVGRLGVLVDHPPKPDNVTPLTVDVAARQGLRPMLQTYPAESIINWKFGRVANSWVLTMVVLQECVAVPEDEFKDKYEDRFRVLDLDPSGEYRQRLFKRENDKDVQIGGDIYPLMNGRALDYIPFAILGADGRGDQIDEPPLLDLVDSNIALYQINADYRHGLHFTGLPTPVISGYTPANESEKIYIGSTSAWIFPDPNAKAAFLEFTGQGLGELQKAIDNKKLEMAMLGARMIADETAKARETLGATQIKRQGENGVLSRIAQAVSEGLEWALGVFAEWAGHSGEVVYQINRDFQPTLIDAPTLTALVASLQAGALSMEEFFDLCQRGDMIRAEVTFEQHQEQIASGGPPAPIAPPNAPPPDKQAAAA
jgi:hypothetical protein